MYDIYHHVYLNKVLKEINCNEDYSLPELVMGIDESPIEKRGNILFNAEGFLNHNLYGLTLIMNLDLQERNYYLLYQNCRSEYINNFFNIVDFVEINKLYEETIQKN